MERKGCEKIGEVENKEILVCEKKDFDSSGREIVFIERVIYGKPDTPIEKREYKIVGKPDSKVGTIKEWEDWSLKNYKVVIIQTIGKQISK